MQPTPLLQQITKLKWSWTHGINIKTFRELEKRYLSSWLTSCFVSVSFRLVRIHQFKAESLSFYHKTYLFLGKCHCLLSKMIAFKVSWGASAVWPTFYIHPGSLKKNQNCIITCETTAMTLVPQAPVTIPPSCGNT